MGVANLIREKHDSWGKMGTNSLPNCVTDEEIEDIAARAGMDKGRVRAILQKYPTAQDAFVEYYGGEPPESDWESFEATLKSLKLFGPPPK